MPARLVQVAPARGRRDACARRLPIRFPQRVTAQAHTQCTLPTPCTFLRCTADSAHRAWHRYGRHALPANDPCWRSASYHEQLLAHASGRATPLANPKAGALESTLLGPHLQRVLGASHVLRSITGGGTEAVRSFWDVADSFSPCADGAQLLLLRGAYLGGSGPLQAISGLEFVRDRAFAPAAARRYRACMVEAPYRRVERFDGGGDGDDDEEEEDMPASAALREEEERCIGLLEQRLSALRAEGVVVSGVLVEFVRAHDGLALPPRYVRLLDELARTHRLLLFEDAVLTGLRCGAAFASRLYGCRPDGRPVVRPQWTAVGKCYGFSGVVQVHKYKIG